MFETQALRLEVIAGMLALLGGVVSLGWGWQIWRRPNKMKPESPMYQFLLADWRAGPRSSTSKGQGLTEKRIKYYAIRAIVGGIFGVLVGLLLVIGLL